jgi:tetratricopeptide (TPR) repeat protein
MKKIIVTILLLCTNSPLLNAQKLTKEQIHSHFTAANHAFQQANTAADPQKQKQYYQQAILNYRKIIEQGQINNPRLYYNLANAYLLSDQLGNAILYYRKALKLAPSDHNIKKNLAFARQRTVDKVEKPQSARIIQKLFFWHYSIPVNLKLFLTVIFFAFSAMLFSLILWFKILPLKVLQIITLILTIVFAASSAVEIYNSQHNQHGVIVAESVTARQGDAENYLPAFKEPLHEGTEFRLLEKRPNWFRIKLANGSTAWIKQTSAKLI